MVLADNGFARQAPGSVNMKLRGKKKYISAAQHQECRQLPYAYDYGVMYCNVLC